MADNTTTNNTLSVPHLTSPALTIQVNDLTIPVHSNTTFNIPPVSNMEANQGANGNRGRLHERFQDRVSRTMQQIRTNVSEQELANLGLNSLVNQYMAGGEVQAAHPPAAQAAVTTAHGHTHAHMPGQGHNHSHAHLDPEAANNQNFVINMGGGNNNGMPDVNQNGGQATQVQGHQIPSVRMIMKTLDGALPFIFLVFAKVMYNHRLGILVFVALFGTFFHANTSLKRHIQLRESQSLTDTLGSLVWITLFLSGNIFFIYFVFDEQKLYRCLYFLLPEVERVDLWNLLWMTGMTDFVVKFATIVVKALVTMLPKRVLPYKKKGKYYMMMETVSQFYRCLIPILPWIYFLQDDQHGGEWFSLVLLILYLVLKGAHTLGKCKELKAAFLKFQVDVSYGGIPNQEQLKGSDHTCPICQDKFTIPIILSCKHIFCEDCVSMWFDRERTCPMCRANIVDNPKWRDGATSGNIQVY